MCRHMYHRQSQGNVVADDRTIDQITEKQLQLIRQQYNEVITAVSIHQLIL